MGVLQKKKEEKLERISTSAVIQFVFIRTIHSIEFSCFWKVSKGKGLIRIKWMPKRQLDNIEQHMLWYAVV